MNVIKFFLPILVVGSISTLASADVVHLKNGDRITGKIKGIWDDNVTIEPEYSDKFDVEFEYIERIETDEPLAVELFDGTKGDYQLAAGTNSGDVKLVASYSSFEVELKKLKKSEEIKDFDWGSHVDLNSTISKGNTDSVLINLQGDLNIKKDDHRYLVDVSAIREEQDGNTTKDQDRVHASYNYLFRDNWFFAMNTSIERDPVALLDHRTSVNPSIGYDVWDDANRTLNYQLGLGYASEKTDGEDESSGVIDWRLRFAYEFFGGDMELFHNHHIYRNTKGRKNFVLNSKTGIRYDITKDIYLNLQLNYDYDTEPAVGTDATDLTFLVGAGLEF